MSAKDIFDKAITLKDGESLLIPCHDLKQQESLRVSLAYQRRVFLGKAEVNFDIVSSKESKNGKPFISITKMPRITTGFIVSEDGDVRTTSLRPDPIALIARDAIDLTRIRQTMREDGFTDAEIDNYIQGESVPKKVSINDTCLDLKE